METKEILTKFLNLYFQHYPTKTPPKQSQATTPSSYRTEISGSYASLDCPSPPGPPILSDKSRDPQVSWIILLLYLQLKLSLINKQARLAIYLKTLYIDLSLKEPILPTWVQPVAPGALCPARLEPELRLSSSSHGLNECISVDQILTAIHVSQSNSIPGDSLSITFSFLQQQTKEGSFLEAPRRILIECPAWLSKSSLALRILHSWAREPPWPQRGQPVALALFVPLSEIKGTLHNYISRELLTKGPPNPFTSGFGSFNSAWNSLEALKGKLLFVLDGYDVSLSRGNLKNRKAKNPLDDVIDLLEGKLFPESRVILIGVASQCMDLLPFMQRHIKYEGLTWGRSASLLGGGQWGAPTRLLDIVQNSLYLRNSIRTPLACLAIAAVYETNGGQLPTEEIDVIDAIINCVAPNIPQSHIAELGRLTLFCLKTKRSMFSTPEIRMYCSSPDSPVIGCFEKCPLFGKTAKRKGEFHYTPICQGIFEFLAANYLVSLSNRPGLLAAEITGLSIADEVEADILKVLKFAMTLLGSRAHILLSKLTTLWLSPQTVFSLALAGGETENNLNALSDMLGISKVPPISPLETNPIWVSITSSINELQGWGLALKSPVCALKNLELMYQVEKTIQLESRNAMDIFLDALSRNESVTTLRISSLIENDVRENDINHLANCISKALLKPRLENFELILTLLEEDPPAMKLQSVVSALCKSIPRQTKLVSVVLDLGLCTSQLVQICAALEKCPHINRLSLPHLRCERGAISALAALLKNRPLSSLALPACWGARDDPPSSSGVSMGSGSASSSGNSGLIKQGSLTGAPSPRAYPPGLFSSLPRGVPPTSTLGRSQTLPRQLLEGPPDKRSQDSVISRTWYPTPACDGGPHNSGTLHDLLFAAREPYSRLHGLDLSKAQLSLEDSMCLGETVRVSSTLHSIKLEGASRLSEILPTVLGAGESPSLQMLSLGSPRLILEDTAITMSARALGSCITLRLLSLDGWSFKFENLTTLAQVRGFLALTSIRELGLSNCRVYLPMFNSVVQLTPESYDCRSIVVLKLSGTQVNHSRPIILFNVKLIHFTTISTDYPCGSDTVERPAVVALLGRLPKPQRIGFVSSSAFWSGKFHFRSTAHSRWQEHNNILPADKPEVRVNIWTCKRRIFQRTRKVIKGKKKLSNQHFLSSRVSHTRCCIIRIFNSIMFN